MRYAGLIREKFDVQEVRGEEFICRCPWHADGDTPNLHVNGRKGVWFCFVCGAKGRFNGTEAVLPVTPLRELRAKLHPVQQTEQVRKFLPETWLRQFAFDHDYWQKRGISEAAVKRFQLGYDPLNNVLTIPLRNHNGRLVGVITRRLDDGRPKYRYPQGFQMSRHLFASWLIKDIRRVALVEGSLDAIACWDARVPAVALLGARLTGHQVRLLQTLQVHQVVIMTDNDKVGLEAVTQIHDALRGSGIMVAVGLYRHYWHVKDPAELTPERRRKMFHSAKVGRSQTTRSP